MLKLCLVGLGNPGAKYNGTKHNIGKEWLLKLSESHCSDFVAKSSIEADITYSQAEEILWVIPDNYVNNSGRTVSKLLKNINLPNNKIIIFHDDLDLNPGEVRLKEGGGHGGHNGLKDIFEKTGTKDYLRIRIGIGHPGNKDLVSDWVLNKFHPTDRKYVDEAYDLFNMNFNTLCAQEFSKLQKQLHTKKYGI